MTEQRKQKLKVEILHDLKELFRPKLVSFSKNSFLQNNLAQKCEIVQKNLFFL